MTKKTFSQSLGGAADHVVGDIILGSVGRAGFHLNKVPGVGHTGRYIGQNIRDGYNAAERSEHKRNAIKSIRALQEKAGVGFTSEQIRVMATKIGVHEEDLDDVQKAALEAAKRLGKSATLPQPEGFGVAPASA